LTTVDAVQAALLQKCWASSTTVYPHFKHSMGR